MDKEKINLLILMLKGVIHYSENLIDNNPIIHPLRMKEFYGKSGGINRPFEYIKDQIKLIEKEIY